MIEKRLRRAILRPARRSIFSRKRRVVCLTGTSIINHTIEELLALCRDAYVVLTAVVPVDPGAFRVWNRCHLRYPCVDPVEVTRYITQAACFKQLPDMACDC